MWLLVSWSFSVMTSLGAAQEMMLIRTTAAKASVSIATPQSPGPQRDMSGTFQSVA
jgi:hypothetical protein